jgi:hypothetical protein
MKVKTITSHEFLAGVPPRPRGTSRHAYRARLDGKSIVVELHGKTVEVQFGATQDQRSVTAFVPGVGFIGGWQWPHRAMPWAYLVESINQGVLHHEMSTLPTNGPPVDSGRRLVIVEVQLRKNQAQRPDFWEFSERMGAATGVRDFSFAWLPGVGDYATMEGTKSQLRKLLRLLLEENVISKSAYAKATADLTRGDVTGESK